MGWRPLWPSMAASAVGLYMSMRYDAPGFYHTKVATAPDAILGTWTHAVRRLKGRYSIRDWVPPTGATRSAAVRKTSLKKYRKQMVMPALIAARAAHPQAYPLPWVWIAANVGRCFSAWALEAWLCLRTFGDTVWPCRRAQMCAFCGVDVGPLRVHLVNECAVFAGAAAAWGFSPLTCFDAPADADIFAAVLRAMSNLVADCTQ